MAKLMHKSIISGCISMLLLSLSQPLWAADEAPARVVSVAPVQSKEMSPTIMVSGQVFSRYQSNLSTGVDGRLDWIVEAGQQVAAGDLLAKLDPRPLQLQINELQAQLKRSQINSSRLQKELTRQKSLVAKALISQTQLDQQQADYDLAIADVELNHAALAQLQDQLARAELKAPFAGVITQRLRQVGEEISRSSPILQLVNLNELEVRVFAPLQYASFVQQGQQIQVFNLQGGQPMAVNALIPVSDVRSQTFEVRLVVDPANAMQYQVGQLVSVALPTATAAQQMVVHRDALVLSKQQHAIFKLSADKVVRVPIELGQGQGEWLQVSGDLAIGDQVVVRGADRLTDGDKIRILTENEFKLAIGR